MCSAFVSEFHVPLLIFVAFFGGAPFLEPPCGSWIVTYSDSDILNVFFLLVILLRLGDTLLLLFRVLKISISFSAALEILAKNAPGECLFQGAKNSTLIKIDPLFKLGKFSRR